MIRFGACSSLASAAASAASRCSSSYSIFALASSLAVDSHSLGVSNQNTINDCGFHKIRKREARTSEE
jgi:hypothetical protein